MTKVKNEYTSEQGRNSNDQFVKYIYTNSNVGTNSKSQVFCIQLTRALIPSIQTTKWRSQIAQAFCAEWRPLVHSTEWRPLVYSTEWRPLVYSTDGENRFLHRGTNRHQIAKTNHVDFLSMPVWFVDNSNCFMHKFTGFFQQFFAFLLPKYQIV